MVARVVVLDYGSGNVRSAVRMLERVGASVELSADHRLAQEADGLFVPGVGNPAYTGSLSEIFSFRDEQVSKTELVIFLRPTVISNPSLDSDELKFFKKFLPRQIDTPTETLPGETAGPPK